MRNSILLFTTDSKFDVVDLLKLPNYSGNGHKPTHSQQYEADPW